jgi:hypothetical protein
MRVARGRGGACVVVSERVIDSLIQVLPAIVFLYDLVGDEHDRLVQYFCRRE